MSKLAQVQLDNKHGVQGGDVGQECPGEALSQQPVLGT